MIAKRLVYYLGEKGLFAPRICFANISASCIGALRSLQTGRGDIGTTLFNTACFTTYLPFFLQQDKKSVKNKP